ncbi:MAG: LysE family translocator [Bacteroidales bacterium]|nr:LysE family translocator [Bacteroidales bacterium]
MFGIQHYWAFVGLGILLNLTPGNDTIYILTRGIGQGRKAAIYSVFGIGTGAVVHILMAALGLSAIIATSAKVYLLIKYAGVIYLIFIGIKTLISKEQFQLNNNSSMMGLNRIFRQGFLTNLLNPKVALFFLSLLPQYVTPDNSYGPVPFLILGLTFFTTGMIWCMVLAYSSSYFAQYLHSNPRTSTILQKGSGIAFILLGIKVAAERRL